MYIVTNKNNAELARFSSFYDAYYWIVDNFNLDNDLNISKDKY